MISSFEKSFECWKSRPKKDLISGRDITFELNYERKDDFLLYFDLLEKANSS